MLFLNADYLFAQVFVDDRIWVLRRCVGGRVVDGVDGEEQIVGG